MLKSGKRAILPPNHRPKKNTATSPQTDPEDSSRPSPLPIVPVPEEEIPTPEKRLRKFLQEHEIERKEYDLCPKVESTAIEFLGTRQKFLETLKFSTDPEVRKFLEFFWQLKTSVQNWIPLEAIFLAAEVSPHLILGAAFTAAQDTIRLKSAFKTIMGHPEIVEKTINRAKTKEGYREKEMVHKAVGWLPSPKGSSINVNLFGSHGPRFGSDEEREPEKVIESSSIDPVSLDAVFGHDSGELEEWSETRANLLEAGK